MNDYPDDLRELYFEFGRTAEVAQVMEVEAGNLALAFVSLAFDPSKITEEDRRFFKAIIDDVNRRTFGNLLKEIRKIGSVSEGIEKIINEALEKRNYLVHKFFRSHNVQINSEEGRKKMRAELNEIYESLSKAHATLLGMTNTLNQVFDRPNISEEEAIELMKKGKRIEI